MLSKLTVVIIATPWCCHGNKHFVNMQSGLQPLNMLTNVKLWNVKLFLGEHSKHPRGPAKHWWHVLCSTTCMSADSWSFSFSFSFYGSTGITLSSPVPKSDAKAVNNLVSMRTGSWAPSALFFLEVLCSECGKAARKRHLAYCAWVLRTLIIISNAYTLACDPSPFSSGIWDTRSSKHPAYAPVSLLPWQTCFDVKVGQ